jgi:polar amino acid transport system substrate-binding protein
MVKGPRRCWAVGGLALVLSVGLWAAPPSTVVLATGEYSPYVSEALSGGGATSVLVQEIFQGAGLKVDLRFFPWKRVESTLQAGQAFAGFPYSKTEERLAAFGFSEPLYRVRNGIVYCPGNPRTPGPIDYTGPKSLAGALVGVIAGSFAEPRLTAAGVMFEESNTVEMGLRKLRAGRIDYYIDDQATLEDTLRRLFPEDSDAFQILPQAFDEEKPNYLMVSRSYPGSEELLRRFNQSLAALQKSGEYTKLLAKLHLPRL